MTRRTLLLLLAACILLVGVNYSIFLHVKSNRKGQPKARLWLTERELPMLRNPGFEEAGLRLELHWRVLGHEAAEDRHGTPFWLTGEKLRRLGFSVDPLSADRQRENLRPEKRPVYIVFEQNGPAFKEAVRRAGQLSAEENTPAQDNSDDRSGRASRLAAYKRVELEERSLSRLFAVDAGTHPEELEKFYSNSSQYFILPGVVQVQVRKEDGRTVVSGFIDSIHLSSIHVPLKFRSAIESLVTRHSQSSRQLQTPRYAVLLSCGQDWEPWIEAVGPVAD
ncbi:MAG: DUF4824 family protein [Desulfobulbus sp.]|nr:DUF4824 family protein [Desulfobulbus sp.]